jgi:hypothetical protein
MTSTRNMVIGAALIVAVAAVVYFGLGKWW